MQEHHSAGILRGTKAESSSPDQLQHKHVHGQAIVHREEISIPAELSPRELAVYHGTNKNKKIEKKRIVHNLL